MEIQVVKFFITNLLCSTIHILFSMTSGERPTKSSDKVENEEGGPSKAKDEAKVKLKTKSKHGKSNHKRRLKKAKSDDTSYFDTGSIAKGLIILGAVFLVMGVLYFIVSTNSPEGSIHEDQIRGGGDIRGTGYIEGLVCISFVLIAIGAIVYFFNRQFTKLSDFAQEVESGEFERKLKEEDDSLED